MDALTAMRRGHELLAQGRLAEGFPLWDRQREVEARRPAMAPELPFVLWRGQDVAGKRILVWSEEGFGDQIMYARFAKALKDRGGEVYWLCPPELARLFRHGLGVTAIPADRPVEFAGFDFYCPSSALPLGFDLNDGPPPPPYLAAPPPVTRPGLRIGVATAGNPKHANDANRSLPAAPAVKLLAIPGAFDLAPARTGARDFYDTASVVAGLDLVISVDTAAAHLAGALGRPLWVLLPSRGGDWRWMATGSRSPWYPAARLYRQGTADWSAIVDQVSRDVGELARAGREAG